MFSKKFWSSLKTWEKVLYYIAVLPVIMLRITVYIVALPLARWSWRQAKLAWYWTKIYYHRMMNYFRALRVSPVERAHFKRIFTVVLSVILLFATVLVAVDIRNDAERDKVATAYAARDYVDHRVVSGESWWSIAMEYCPSYMNVGGHNGDTDYLIMLQNENKELSEQEFLRIGDIVRIPVLPD